MPIIRDLLTENKCCFVRELLYVAQVLIETTDILRFGEERNEELSNVREKWYFWRKSGCLRNIGEGMSLGRVNLANIRVMSGRIIGSATW